MKKINRTSYVIFQNVDISVRLVSLMAQNTPPRKNDPGPKSRLMSSYGFTYSVGQVNGVHFSNETFISIESVQKIRREETGDLEKITFRLDPMQFHEFISMLDNARELFRNVDKYFKYEASNNIPVALLDKKTTIGFIQTPKEFLYVQPALIGDSTQEVNYEGLSFRCNKSYIGYLTAHEFFTFDSIVRGVIHNFTVASMTLENNAFQRWVWEYHLKHNKE